MKFLYITALLLLSACGFSPVYGTYNDSASKIKTSTFLSNIKIEPLPDRKGQYLRNALIDRFYKNGYPKNPKYQLSIGTLNEKKTAFDITIESEATRYQLKISTNLNLKDLKTNNIILKRNIYSVSSYNVLTSEFTTRVSEQNAREAILNDLARQIEQQIALYLNRQ